MLLSSLLRKVGKAKCCTLMSFVDLRYRSDRWKGEKEGGRTYVVSVERGKKTMVGHELDPKFASFLFLQTTSIPLPFL